MPFYLKNTDITSDIKKYNSVLIVPCRFCPAASLAMTKNEPYIELFSEFLKTASYEQYIKELKTDIRNMGIKADVFKTILLHQFVLCCWTGNRRKELSERAKGYEALLVLGCEGAVKTVEDSVKSTECQVIMGMETKGLMSVKPSFHLPCNISIDLDSVSPILYQENHTRAAKVTEPDLDLHEYQVAGEPISSHMPR